MNTGIIKISARFVASRMAESIVVILGTALAVAVLAAVVNLISVYNATAKKQLELPSYRELTVTPKGEARNSEVSVEKLGDSSYQPANLTTEDMEAAKQDSPLIAYTYQAMRTMYTTQNTTFGASGGMPNVMIFMGGTGGGAGLSAEGGLSASGGGGGMPPAGMGGGPPPDMGGIPPDGAAAQGDNASIAAEMEKMRTEMAAAQAEAEAVAKAQITEEPLVTQMPGWRVTSEYFAAYGLEAAEGSLFTDNDVAQGSLVAIVGSKLATKLYSDGQCLGKKILLNGSVYTIIGVLAPDPYAVSTVSTNRMQNVDEGIITPYGGFTMRRGSTTITMAMPVRELSFAVVASADLNGAQKQLLSYFTAKYGENSVDVRSLAERIKAQSSNQNRLFAILGFLAVAAIFVAFLNIFNLMTARLMKRSRDIGIFMAVGAPKNTVGVLLMVETAIMSLAGGLIGIAVSPFAAGFIAKSVIFGTGGGSVLGISVPVLLGCGLAVIAATVVAGAIPAMQGTRIRPIDALKNA